MTKPTNQANIFERLAELGGIQAQQGINTVKDDVIEQVTGKLPTTPNPPNPETASSRNFTPLDTGRMEANFKEQHDNPELAAARSQLDQIAFARFKKEEKTFYTQQEQEAARAKKQADEDEALKRKQKKEEVPEYPETPQAPKRGQKSRKANIENKLSKGA